MTTYEFTLWGLSQVVWVAGAVLIALAVAIYLEDN